MKNIIELPLKFNQQVYCIFGREIAKGKVKVFNIEKNNISVVVEFGAKGSTSFNIKSLGKSFFEEEISAVNKLNEMDV